MHIKSKLVSLAEGAELIGRSLSTIKRWRRYGIISKKCSTSKGVYRDLFLFSDIVAANVAHPAKAGGKAA